MLKFEFTDITNQYAILTVINSGRLSRQALESIKYNINEINFLIDDVGIMSCDKINIKNAIKSSDMLIIVADLDDDNESQMAYTVCETSKHLEILTVVIGIMPLSFYDSNRHNIAYKNINKIRPLSDTLLLITDEHSESNIGIQDIIKIKQKMVSTAIFGVTEMIYSPGLIRVDFADVRAVLSGGNISFMGYGVAQGPNREIHAGKQAISQLLNNSTSDIFNILSDCTETGILLTMKAGADMKLIEFENIGNLVKELSHENTTVVVGTVIEPDMDEMQVTVIVTKTGCLLEFV